MIDPKKVYDEFSALEKRYLSPILPDEDILLRLGTFLWASFWLWGQGRLDDDEVGVAIKNCLNIAYNVGRQSDK